MLMKISLSFSYFLIFSLLSNAWRPLSKNSVLCGFLTFLLLLIFALVNDITGAIPEKVASFVAYEMFRGEIYQTNFLLQYALAYIPMALFDYEYSAHALNIAMQAWLFMFASQHIFKNKIDWKLIAFLLYPSYYHYSIFGLRDPMINMVSTLVVIAVISSNLRGITIMCIFLGLLSLVIRPEYSMILIGFIGLLYFFDASVKGKIFLIMVGFVGLYMMLLLLPLAFGFPSTGSAMGNIEAMSVFNESRALRHEGTEYGAGSHILGGGLYGLDFHLRYPIQLAASFLAPLPTDIRGGFDIFAFVESLGFCAIVLLAAKRRNLNPRTRFLFWAGMMYMGLQAIFAINYGNILRVRYPGFLFFIGALVCADVIKQKPRSRRKGVSR